MLFTQSDYVLYMDIYLINHLFCFVVIVLCMYCCVSLYVCFSAKEEWPWPIGGV